jgi:hypothetical protein
MKIFAFAITESFESLDTAMEGREALSGTAATLDYVTV